MTKPSQQGDVINLKWVSATAYVAVILLGYQLNGDGDALTKLNGEASNVTACHNNGSENACNHFRRK